MSVWTDQIPDSEAFKSGSGTAYLNSRGGLLYDMTVNAGSVRGTVRMYNSTSASAGTQKVWIRVPVNTQGNSCVHYTFNPPVSFTKKIRVKRNGGGTGASLNSRMVVKFRFLKAINRHPSA